ncbi:MAG TPA: hypothetical protein VFI73_10190 [Candidatus Nitrosopolaris sp.]|nr:hypothetical protein [Candidatus Nitrosopolaris sp.]
MALEKDQQGYISNPFLDPIAFWQNYLINLIEANRGFYENASKANEYWLKAFWDPWLKAAGLERKETAKVE